MFQLLRFTFGDGTEVNIDVREFGVEGAGKLLDYFARQHNGIMGVIPRASV